MRARHLALALLLLAALAALAARRSGYPSPLPRLAGLLALPAPTVTETARAGRAALAETVLAVDLVEPEVAPPASFVVTSAAGRPLVPGQPRQLGNDGCCYGAWWSDDSQRLYFVDRPAGAEQATLYQLPLWPPGQAAEPADLQLMGGGPGDGRYDVQPAEDAATVRDLETGQTWRLPTNGNPLRVSPDGSRVVWWSGRSGRQSDTEVVQLWSSHIDGSNPVDLGGLWDATVIAFLPDNRRVLVSGRPAVDRATAILATLDVDTGALKSIAKGLWLDNALPSPDGRRVVYTTSLDQEDPAANGVWLASVDGGPPRKLPFEGAYRWRDGDRLVYIPLAPGAYAHEVREYDARSEDSRPLLDPANAPIRVANNDWSVSPDGQTLAWVAEDDRNLWVVDLPE